MKCLIEYFLSLQNLKSTDLIDHLSSFFDSDDSKSCLQINDYLSLCIACSQANYKPSNWDSKILPAIKTFGFHRYLLDVEKFDWIRFAVILNSLGFNDIMLIKSITETRFTESIDSYHKSDMKKLQDILARENSSSGSSEMCRHSSPTNEMKSLLKQDLENMIGAKRLWTDLNVNARLTIPFVLKMNLRSGDFLPITDKPTKQSVGEDELL